jgi:F-type H+-transporting ATPase subunit epsilon
MLKVRVVSPQKVVYEGDASAVVAPAWDGKVGILPRHAPMITLLGAGVLSVEKPGGGSQQVYVAGGALQVLDDQVTVLAEYAGDSAPATLPAGLIRPEDIGDEVIATKGNPLV